MAVGGEWTTEFYETSAGVRPVADFLSSLDQKTRARFGWSMRQLRVRNVQARYPLVRHLEGDLWELREESQTNIYRIVYFFYTGRRIIFVHGFQKKSQKAPARELEVARSRYREFLARQEARRGRVAMTENDTTPEQQAYQEYWASQMADPEFREIYEQEAAKKELWLQLVEARLAAGLTQSEIAQRLGVSQAQVARIEKRGYDAYTLTTLRRYVDALGGDFHLEVKVTQDPARAHAPLTPTS